MYILFKRQEKSKRKKVFTLEINSGKKGLKERVDRITVMYLVAFQIKHPIICSISG